MTGLGLMDPNEVAKVPDALFRSSTECDRQQSADRSSLDGCVTRRSLRPRSGRAALPDPDSVSGSGRAAATVADFLFVLRSTLITFAHSAKNSSPVVSPTPLVPPVISATLPASLHVKSARSTHGPRVPLTAGEALSAVCRTRRADTHSSFVRLCRPCTGEACQARANKNGSSRLPVRYRPNRLSHWGCLIAPDQPVPERGCRMWWRRHDFAAWRRHGRPVASAGRSARDWFPWCSIGTA